MDDKKAARFNGSRHSLMEQKNIKPMLLFIIGAVPATPT